MRELRRAAHRAGDRRLIALCRSLDAATLQRSIVDVPRRAAEFALLGFDEAAIWGDPGTRAE